MKKFLIGCAIFVGLVILLGIGGSFVLIQQLKNSFPDMDRLDSVEKELIARDGRFESEVMPLDGTIPAETLERYVDFRRAFASRVEEAARPLQQLIDSDAEKMSGFSKLRTIVSGGLDVARSSVVVSGVADSLLLETGLTRGEAVYLMCLVRYGVGDFASPLDDDDFLDEGEGEGREKMMEVIEEFEDELRKRAFVLFENQRRELSALESRDDRQEAWLASLEFVLKERPRALSNLKGRLHPWQLEALEPRLLELRESWPELPAEYFLDLLPAVDDDEAHDGIQIEF